MTRKSTLRAGLIGNGLFAQASRRESLFEVYQRIQRICKHERCDSRGLATRAGIGCRGRVLVVEVIVHFGRADSPLGESLGYTKWPQRWRADFLC